ncbi:polyprenyl synthetase family protein [Streptomyces qinzhouensis]|uniref:polyprenyl synthetase family protein n=1 Tax=Streptomyces qinzhouensis TaxID=2599401 RepID=UPI001FE71E64|nr:polyprenyl synthetase family protein [Streptomyces qinzhouensis]
MTHQISAALAAFVDDRVQSAVARSFPVDVPLALGEFLNAGGKRLRPLLRVLGWRAAGGTGPMTSAIRFGAALEMFHVFCLIHDDVMDDPDTRRGRPTVHRALAKRHRNGRTAQAAERVGVSAAILAGDLALVWSDELLNASEAQLEPEVRTRVLRLVGLMRTEVLFGQYMDLEATGRPSADADRAPAIVRYKTATYTCERPLQIGAALAGAFLDRLSAFALPLGEAFQLRDDLLGVFGQQAETGKSVLDDLREGKHTLLIALALNAADPHQERLIRGLYGNPRLDERAAGTLREVLRATGADRAVEDVISSRHAQSLAALDAMPLDADVRAELAEQAAWRSG